MLQQKAEKVRRHAQAILRRNPDWTYFFRKVLGPEGLVAKTFPNAEELKAFRKTSEYGDILRLAGKLLNENTDPLDKEETRMITVRLPSSMHAFLKDEAKRQRTSVNKLCITRLLQVVEESEELETEVNLAGE